MCLLTCTRSLKASVDVEHVTCHNGVDTSSHSRKQSLTSVCETHLLHDDSLNCFAAFVHAALHTHACLLLMMYSFVVPFLSNWFSYMMYICMTYFLLWNTQSILKNVSGIQLIRTAILVKIYGPVPFMNCYSIYWYFVFLAWIYLSFISVFSRLV